MKKNVIVSLADSNYFPLLNELIDSIKRFKESSEVAICILDAGLSEDQKTELSSKVDEIKSAEWDIKVPDSKIKGREWLKSQVSRAFLPKYFPSYEKYLWIDCDAWVNDWQSVELYFKACENGKLGITQTIGPGYKITSRVNWVFGKLAIIKSQNFKVLSINNQNLSIASVKYYLKEGDKFIKNGDFDKAKDLYLDARKLAKQLASFYSDINSSFNGIDASIPNEMKRKGKQTLQILAESNERLASVYIKTEKPEVAVPLLIETIRIMSPNSSEGKEAYERLIQLGFVETKYKG